MMHSGAAHDTMSIVDLVPSAIVFVPCKDGKSHAPEQGAEAADAALGTEVMLNAIRGFSRGQDSVTTVGNSLRDHSGLRPELGSLGSRTSPFLSITHVASQSIRSLLP